MFMYSTQRNFFLFLSLSRCSVETTKQAERGRDGSECHEDSAGALCVCMLIVHCMGVFGLQECIQCHAYMEKGCAVLVAIEGGRVGSVG